MKLKICELTTLYKLPEGSLFLTLNKKTLGLKTEYITEAGTIESFIVGSGEMFWGGVYSGSEHNAIEVYRVEVESTETNHVEIEINEKLVPLVDMLLEKTQNGHCDWKYTPELIWENNPNMNFKLFLTNGIIHLHLHDATIIMDVADNAHVPLTSLMVGIFEVNNNLNKLYEAVVQYYNKSSKSYIDKLLTDIEKLGSF